MRVACLQEHLQRALNRVGRAVASRTALPVLSNVLLSTDNGKLRVAATNLDIGVTTWIDADIEEEGRITVDARLLGEFVNTLPAGAISLTTDDVRMSLTVQSGRDKASINGIDAEDFPVIPSVSDDGFSVDVDGQMLREMISLVEFSAATDESRPVLAGVHTRFDGDNLTLSAADGFRMAVSEHTLSAPVSEIQELIIPAKSYRELARLIGDHEGPIRIAVTPNRSQVLVRIEPQGEDDQNVTVTEWVSRLIDGTFPDVKQIVPKDFATRVDIGRETLLNAVRRAGYFARDSNDVVFLTVQPGEDDLSPGNVEVSANAAERGNSQSFVDASVTGNEIRVAFNGKYLTDVLAVLRQGQVMIGLNGASQAGIVRPASSEDYTHVIMPMVIGGQ